jgi:biofilm PGA synthesis N-glycosyltransferase PgaC
LYRIIVFWFRFSGFLHAIAETGTWRVSDPWVQVKAGGQDVWQRLAQAWRRFRQRG